ncbi:hypothetical protein POSPLADRAFT_1049549 [Postia placenta MAD-698-R-SB12]|uniref:Uncharacterized protein n=1 Tax=Postia placenta MAD-698-R-SB12 TaxID=670580 RepID=A0A1X6MPK5_9APHY|nr:hypothetical protein POSPLADRAFT_1049549 [Postia placenta MAD-698-R-SB12]OSX58347.1 hypothetical protein POSPLADRAFT_1049549 [Postia placenta MAD-698-R-SB12]
MAQDLCEGMGRKISYLPWPLPVQPDRDGPGPAPEGSTDSGVHCRAFDGRARAERRNVYVGAPSGADWREIAGAVRTPRAGTGRRATHRSSAKSRIQVNLITRASVLDPSEGGPNTKAGVQTVRRATRSARELRLRSEERTWIRRLSTAPRWSFCSLASEVFVSPAERARISRDHVLSQLAHHACKSSAPPHISITVLSGLLVSRDSASSATPSSANVCACKGLRVVKKDSVKWRFAMMKRLLFLVSLDRQRLLKMVVYSLGNPTYLPWFNEPICQE